MKKADNPAVIINGSNNNVEVNITVNDASSKISVAIAIVFVTILVATVLAVSYCCPELLADFVRWIVSTVING